MYSCIANDSKAVSKKGVCHIYDALQQRNEVAVDVIRDFHSPPRYIPKTSFFFLPQRSSNNHAASNQFEVTSYNSPGLP